MINQMHKTYLQIPNFNLAVHSPGAENQAIRMELGAGQRWRRKQKLGFRTMLAYFFFKQHH